MVNIVPDLSSSSNPDSAQEMSIEEDSPPGQLPVVRAGRGCPAITGSTHELSPHHGAEAVPSVETTLGVLNLDKAAKRRFLKKTALEL